MPQVIAQFLALLVIGLATAAPVVAWGQTYSWEFSHRTASELFPLFGLLAYSLMWQQVFVLNVFRNLSPNFRKWFGVIAGLAIFICILLHPLLLARAQFELTDKLPPESWYKYVSGKYREYITLGVIAWLTFLAYDVARLVKNTTWYPRYSWIIRYSGHAAFFLIFIHSTQLGSHLQSGIFRALWMFFAASALVIISREAYRDIKQLTSRN
jgi:hypothetical protein